MSNVHISFVISAALIVLGFVALLTQKIYLDSTTGQPTEIEVPLTGKLKSNYPALVFVFLGFGLAAYTYRTSLEKPKVEWTLRGSLTHPQHKQMDWSRVSLTLIPRDLDPSISQQGHFEITAKIEEGKTLEDIYEILDFSAPEGSAQINLKDEYQKYHNGKQSMISSATEHTRTYAPMKITIYPGT